MYVRTTFIARPGIAICGYCIQLTERRRTSLVRAQHVAARDSLTQSLSPGLPWLSYDTDLS
jgi:hypothetical protein